MNKLGPRLVFIIFIFISLSTPNSSSGINLNSQFELPKPTNLQLTDYRNGTVLLDWDPPSSDIELNITNYKVYRGINKNELIRISMVPGSNSVYADNETKSARTYYYSIVALSSEGNSDYSDIVSIYPLSYSFMFVFTLGLFVSCSLCYKYMQERKFRQSGFLNKVKYKEAFKLGYNNIAEHKLAKLGGFQTGEEMRSANRAGFDNRQEFITAKDAGFDNKSEYITSLALDAGFDNSTEYIAAIQAGYNNYDEFISAMNYTTESLLKIKENLNSLSIQVKVLKNKNDKITKINNNDAINNQLGKFTELIDMLNIVMHETNDLNKNIIQYKNEFQIDNLIVLETEKSIRSDLEQGIAKLNDMQELEKERLRKIHILEEKVRIEEEKRQNKLISILKTLQQVNQNIPLQLTRLAQLVNTPVEATEELLIDLLSQNPDLGEYLSLEQVFIKRSEIIESTISSISRPTDKIQECLDCGSKQSVLIRNCTECHTELPFCQVCKRGFSTDEEILRCDHCDNPFHRNHLLEYVKIKGECPVCKRMLKL